MPAWCCHFKPGCRRVPRSFWWLRCCTLGPCCSAASAACSGRCFPAATSKRRVSHGFRIVTFDATSPLVGEVGSHRRCDPGEGFRSHDRPRPLTPTLSQKGRGSAPPLRGPRAISIQMDLYVDDASLAHLFDTFDTGSSRARGKSLECRRQLFD